MVAKSKMVSVTVTQTHLAGDVRMTSQAQGQSTINCRSGGKNVGVHAQNSEPHRSVPWCPLLPGFLQTTSIKFLIDSR